MLRPSCFTMITVTFKQDFDLTDTVESILALDDRTVADISDEELRQIVCEEFEDHDFNKRALNFLQISREEPGQHFIVGGRIPDNDNVTSHIFVHEDDDRTAFQVFVEEVLYDGVLTNFEMRQREERLPNYNPLDDNALPPDWRERDPTSDETPHGVWAYLNCEIEIPGPPLGEPNMPEFE